MQISFKKLENIILLDPVLTAKILKVFNSSLYTVQSDIMEPSAVFLPLIDDIDEDYVSNHLTEDIEDNVFYKIF